MDLGIAGEKAIHGGAGAGLGKAGAMSLAREGVEVIIVARPLANIEAAAEEIRSATDARVTPVAADITTDEGRALALQGLSRARNCRQQLGRTAHRQFPRLGSRCLDRGAERQHAGSRLYDQGYGGRHDRPQVRVHCEHHFERGEGSDQHPGPFKQLPVRFHHRSELADRRRQVPGDLLMLSAERAIRVAGGAEEVHLVTEEAVQNWGVAGGARDGLQPTV